MRKSIFLAAAALVMLAGCAKNDVTPVANDNQQITYQTVIGKTATKTLIDNPQTGTTQLYPTAQVFGTAAYIHEADWLADTNPGNATAGIYIAESPVKYFTSGYWSTVALNDDGSVGTTDVPYYWPVGAGKLTFFSYSPWGEGANGTDKKKLNEVTEISATDGVKITGWNVDENQTVDVMVADVAANLNDNNKDISGWKKGVSTVFRHKLSQIVGFVVSTKEDYIAATDNTPVAGDMHVYVNSIKIKNVYTTGTYVSGKDVSSTQLGTWTTSGEKNGTGYELVSYPNTWTGDGESKTLTSVNTTKEITHTASDNENKFTVSYAPTGGSNQNYLLVLPQKFTNNSDTDAQLEITYTVRQYYNSSNYVDEEFTKSVDLHAVHTSSPADADADHQWLMNKMITYSIVIDVRGDNRIYWAPEVANWETQTLGGYTIE